ncbi:MULTISPECIES: DUF4433 domain-containing protein [unclassified Micromonospora]|uniref:DUF4433 domain-containing protein n=1 Tax=unclassified Micromonospora TaxID=2617518 RepID=UPI003A83D73D
MDTALHRHRQSCQYLCRRPLACDVSARAGIMRTEVGDPAIKDSRRRRRIPIGPRGYVGDYVPFHFAPRSPMMYRIACDHRDSIAGRYADGDRPLVYLAVTVGAVVEAGAAWLATDDNAAIATSAFTTALDDLDNMVDWPLVQAERWNSTVDDPDRRRRRMAQFLEQHPANSHHHDPDQHQPAGKPVVHRWAGVGRHRDHRDQHRDVVERRHVRSGEQSSGTATSAGTARSTRVVCRPA